MAPRLGAYRALLRLLPPDFRDGHGTHLERVFLDMCVEWDAARGGTGAFFWLAVGWDTARVAAVEWLRVCGRLVRSLNTPSLGETMTSFVADVRYAVRQLLRQPMHGSTVILLMALGVGGNAAVFRVFDGLFLKPLPFEHPEQLVDMDETAPSWDLDFTGLAYPDFLEWRRNNSSFTGMAAYTQGGANLSDGTSATRVSYVAATWDLADVLGIQPEIGRFFSEAEDRPDAPRVALITHGFWERQFGSDPAVVGRTVILDASSVEIIGVLPPQADFVADAELWMPLREDPDGESGWYLTGVGRLEPGVDLARAGADLLAIHKGMIEQREVNTVTAPVLNSLRDRYLGRYRSSSGFLLAAVGVVLVLACANIAGLMSARSLARGPEIGVRLAMGAPRGRIVRQLLTESALLAGAGAVAGGALGVWGSSLLVRRMVDQFPSWVVFELDGRFLVFTLVVTAAAVVLFGLAPALQAAARPAGVMAAGARATGSRRRRRALGALVAGQVALAATLLIVSGLSVLDVRRLGEVDPGFAVDDVHTFRVQVPELEGGRYDEPAARQTFIEEYVARLRSIPGVEGAAVATTLPLSGHWGTLFQVEGAPPRAESESNPVVLYRFVTPGYFETMQVRLVKGRVFDEFDGRDDSTRVAIVNETFVHTHMSDGVEPVGRRIRTGDDDPWLTVVGVSHDVKHYGVDQVMRPGVDQPMRQGPPRTLQVAVRTAAGAASPYPAARAATAAMDPDLPLFTERTMRALMDDSLWARRATSWLIAAFSVVALSLAVAGLYGVISYTVGQRTREISVRMALGAQSAQVRRQVVAQGMGLVVAGLLMGVGGALALEGLVAGILSQVSPRDPIAYLSVSAILVFVAAVANWVPARRAAALDPMNALRGE